VKPALCGRYVLAVMLRPWTTVVSDWFFGPFDVGSVGGSPTWPNELTFGNRRFRTSSAAISIMFGSEHSAVWPALSMPGPHWIFNGVAASPTVSWMNATPNLSSVLRQ
jgi:hypothetical protein